MDIIKICDLLVQEMVHLQLSPNDEYSQVLEWYICHITLKWKSIVGVQRIETEMLQQNDTEQREESIEP